VKTTKSGSFKTHLNTFSMRHKRIFFPEMGSGKSWIDTQFFSSGLLFARSLSEKYGVLIGIINATVGGSPGEAWMSAGALKSFPEYLTEAEKFKNQTYITEIQSKEIKASDEWYGLHSEMLNLKRHNSLKM